MSNLYITLMHPQTDIEWKIYNAAQLPGPGQYKLPDEKSKMTGGRFNTAHPKGENVAWLAWCFMFESLSQTMVEYSNLLRRLAK